jgi:deazaflavin-dependent oxidoreductase (nitroreductase family)
MSEERRAGDRRFIDDFRAHAGSLPHGPLAGLPALLLHHTGARSAAAYVTPLAYLPDGGRWVVFAANGGRPNHPGWYYNLLAHPLVGVEVGTRVIPARAREAEGGEREELCVRFRGESPYFAPFESATARRIPVMVLEALDVPGEFDASGEQGG